MESEAYIRSELDGACADAGLEPGCVAYAVVVDPLPGYEPTEDCPVREVRIPDPTYDADVPGTPHQDNLITIAINDPCDGVIATTSPAAGSG